MPIQANTQTVKTYCFTDGHWANSFFKFDMLKYKRFLRLLSLVLLIILALSGIGIGAAFNPRRERIDNEVRIELVEGEAETEEKQEIKLAPP